MSIDAEQWVKFLKRLRTVREFRPEAPPAEVIEDLLEVARWSGSASNRQPWEFVVIQRRETLQTLAALEGYVKHLAGAAFAIALVMAGERQETEIWDEGRVSERLMLAAAAHGVGSAPGWFQGGGVDEAKRLLGIPEGRRFRTALSFGYPDLEGRRQRPKRDQPRKPMVELVHWERYTPPL